MGIGRTVGIALGGVALLGGVGAIGFLGVLALLTVADGSEPAEAAPADPPPTVAAPAPDPQPAEGDWADQAAALTGIPPRALAAYVAADAYAREELGCDVGWNTLAGIGWVESHHGTLQGGSIEDDGVARPGIRGIPLDGENETMRIPDSDGGALDGDTEWDRAVGPMQFIPETWRIWGVSASGEGEPSPHSIDDAAFTAARYLCQTDGTLAEPEQWIRAIRSYNDTADYQQRVAATAEGYRTLTADIPLDAEG
ncbi:lytic transglycosylase domain-containing protein [Microbacterium sp. gxy059]|uniref:lytic transglycosylase domain-containing protein n=1 Tax=Microbacterium sp. gxy059 TaxID=2957199 RepID=UPI003D9990F6